MSQIEQDLRALQVEWIVARAVVALGVLVTAGVFTWAVLHRAPNVGIEGAAGSAAVEGAGQSGAQNAAQQFCSSTVAVAQSFGIVPSNATPAGDPQKTDVQGR